MQYNFSNKMQGMKPSIIREILKQMSDLQLISFAGGNPAAESFPCEDIANISNKILQESPVSALQYSVTEGVPAARQAVKAYINSRFETARADDELLIVSGSQQAIDFAAKCFCNEGDVVAVEEPAFIGAYNTFRSHGTVLRGVALKNDGVNLASLEAALSQAPRPKIFYCIPNFQNPTGVVTCAQKRKAIYDLCLKYNVIILEDDPYGELRIKGDAIAPIKSLDSHGIVIYAGSFSKILSPGMRLAFCIANKEIAAKITVAKQCCDVHTNVWAQMVAAQFLTSCDINAHLTRVRDIYTKKALLMESSLRQSCPALQFSSPLGGMFIWAALPQKVNMQDFVKKCLDKKLALIPGNVFYTDENTLTNAVRINFSTPTAESIEKGTAIMKEVLDNL